MCDCSVDAGTLFEATNEANAWRNHFDASTSGIGSSLMSEAVRHEMINGTDEQFTDDSDNDTVALERAAQTVSYFTTATILNARLWFCFAGSKKQRQERWEESGASPCE
jgi:hypothetical protein